MASVTLGRVVCPLNCGHQAAQVKLKTDKAGGKEAFPYVHCADCGTQLHTKNKSQAAHLMKMTRPEKGQDAPGPAPGVETDPVDTSTPPAPKKPAGGLLAGFGLPAF